MSERDTSFPLTKRRRCYRLCEHCSKEVSIKIYKEHQWLFYDPVTKSWCKKQENLSQSSSDLSSLDGYDLQSDFDEVFGQEQSNSDSLEWENESQFSDELTSEQSTDPDDMLYQGTV